RYFFFQAEDGIRDRNVTGVQTWLFRSHSGGACPDGVQQRLWFVAERGNACGKRFKVCFYKEFLIHRKKRSVQIEEDCRYHWLCRSEERRVGKECRWWW